MSSFIDINADVGEGVSNEHLLMPYLTSCNVACGGHTGSINTITKVARLAKKHNVKVGAHPSFPDKENFGRKIMKLPKRELQKSIYEQISIFLGAIEKEEMNCHHIKPHGALYNLAAKDENTAKLVIEVLKEFSTPFLLYVPYNSAIAHVAKQNNFPICLEAFIDRRYNSDLSLVDRSSSDAIIRKIKDAVYQVLTISQHQEVQTVNGQKVHIEADTFCIHGDHPQALIFLKNIVTHLKDKGIASKINDRF